MSIIRLHHQRLAQALIVILGAGLLFALWPYMTGLIGGPVLFVTFRPLYQRMTRRMRPALAATAAVVLAVVLLVLPSLTVAAMVVGEADDVIRRAAESNLVERVSALRLGPFALGPQLVTLGEAALGWVGSGALTMVGAATRVALNITIALFGLYFLLLRSDAAWAGLAPYVPFNENNTLRLRKRFRDVTYSTLIGTGLIALAQGVLMAVTFWAVGLPSPLFWGVVTAVVSILPVVGSGLIWVPGTIALVFGGNYVAAGALGVVGVVIVGGVDNVIRPIVYNRWAQVHPIVTLVGALAGIRFFGLLGLLIGPLALSYFFELIGMYKEEYLAEDEPNVATHLTGEPIGLMPPSLRESP